MLQLSSQIASLEQENVGPKDWATMGEAQSRDRPVNSLLEEDLDFERMGKVAPAVTEETTRTIEDLIKQRILAHQFDDVERRVAVDPNQFLPSRYIELQDTKSQKSLAEVYEDEYRDQREREQGNEVVQELDKDLMKRHDEIEALFEDLAARLDALSNAHFTPKAVSPALRCSGTSCFTLSRETRLSDDPSFLTPAETVHHDRLEPSLHLCRVCPPDHSLHLDPPRARRSLLHQDGRRPPERGSSRDRRRGSHARAKEGAATKESTGTEGEGRKGGTDLGGAGSEEGRQGGEGRGGTQVG